MDGINATKISDDGHCVVPARKIKAASDWRARQDQVERRDLMLEVAVESVRDRTT